ncbi:MAG: hypothetical protein KA763_00450 [Xanthomonadales bacterium]|nr:hypothetical protein [Xanthomonadales bacterium]
MLIDELAKAMYEANRVQVESSFPRPEWAYADHSSRAYWIRTATGTLPFIQRHIEARELAAVACVVDETERLGGATNPAADAQGEGCGACGDACNGGPCRLKAESPVAEAEELARWCDEQSRDPDNADGAATLLVIAETLRRLAKPVDSVNTSAATCIESGGKCADAQGVEALADDDAARKAYGEYTGNHPVMHCNRFPAWSELGDAEREKWREKARRLTAAGVMQASGGAHDGAAVRREFNNELSNWIKITIEGPTSMSENILTPLEVSQLRGALNDHASAIGVNQKLTTDDSAERMNEINLAVIRQWPDGFQSRLYHVWDDVRGMIPNIRLYDIQRVLSEFGFTMVVYDTNGAAERGVSDGWVMVPVIPTDEMVRAANDARDDRIKQRAAASGALVIGGASAAYTFHDTYRAMLAAAPPPPAATPNAQACERKRRVFVDMDGVIVDFDAYKVANGMTGDEVKRTPGAYLAMPAIPGAIDAVRSVIGMGYEVWIATKPPTGVPYAYSDKAAWILQHLPELKHRIIMTHDKGLLGDTNDFLCDDRPHKANCERFAGTLLRFVDEYHWPQALAELSAANRAEGGDK